MDVKSLIQGMLSPSKADLWVVMLYTNYLLAGMNFVKCVCKMKKDHYVVIAKKCHILPNYFSDTSWEDLA